MNINFYTNLLVIYITLMSNYAIGQHHHHEEVNGATGQKFSYFNGIQYWYNYQRERTFSEAYRACTNPPFRGRLAMIKTEEIQKHIELNLPRFNCQKGQPSRKFYIGLNDIKQEGWWRWPDGSWLLGSDYSNWRTVPPSDDECGNEPNGNVICENTGVRRKDQDRVVISACANSVDFAKWFDDPLVRDHFFICQRRQRGTLTTTTKTTTTTTTSAATTIPTAVAIETTTQHDSELTTNIDETTVAKSDAVVTTQANQPPHTTEKTTIDITTADDQHNTKAFTTEAISTSVVTKPSNAEKNPNSATSPTSTTVLVTSQTESLEDATLSSTLPKNSTNENDIVTHDSELTSDWVTRAIETTSVNLETTNFIAHNVKYTNHIDTTTSDKIGSTMVEVTPTSLNGVLYRETSTASTETTSNIDTVVFTQELTTINGDDVTSGNRTNASVTYTTEPTISDKDLSTSVLTTETKVDGSTPTSNEQDKTSASTQLLTETLTTSSADTTVPVATKPVLFAEKQDRRSGDDDTNPNLSEEAQKAQEIIASKLQRCFGDYVTDATDDTCKQTKFSVFTEEDEVDEDVIDIWESRMSPFIADIILKNDIKETIIIGEVDGVFVKASSLNHRQRSSYFDIDLSDHWNEKIRIARSVMSSNISNSAMVTAIYGTEAINKGGLRSVFPSSDFVTRKHELLDGEQHTAKFLSLNASVISASYYEYDHRKGKVSQRSIPVEISFNIAEDTTAVEWLKYSRRKIQKGGINRQCVYYDTTKQIWSSYGCVTIMPKPSTLECHCNHTTSFAVMVSITTVEIPPELNKALIILEIVTTAFLLVTLGILVAFKNKLRKDRVFTQINLTASLTLLHTFFLLGSFAESSDIFCIATTVLSHYFLIAASIWMLNEGVVLYMKICTNSLNFDMNKLYPKLLIVGWGIPAGYVGLCAGVGLSTHTYMDTTDAYTELERHSIDGNELFNNYTKYDQCWLSTSSLMILTAAIPLFLILSVNSYILVRISVVVWKMSSRSQDMQHSEARNKSDRFSTNTKATFKATLLLFPILGLPWVLSFFVNIPGAEIVFVAIHGALSGLQGEMLFLIYICFNHDMQRAIRLKIHKLSPYSLSSNKKSNTLSRETASHTLSHSSKGSHSNSYSHQV